ncbi:hypothetical protein SEVIR_1G323450v4 [Setaria viridis]
MRSPQRRGKSECWTDATLARAFPSPRFSSRAVPGGARTSSYTPPPRISCEAFARPALGMGAHAGRAAFHGLASRLIPPVSLSAKGFGARKAPARGAASCAGATR